MKLVGLCTVFPLKACLFFVCMTKNTVPGDFFLGADYVLDSRSVHVSLTHLRDLRQVLIDREYSQKT